MGLQRNAWQGIWQQLPRSLRGQLVALIPFALFGVMLAICTITILLIGTGWRAVEWLREQPSAYSAMDNRTYTHCLRRVDSLHDAASELVRLENVPGLTGEAAYRSWLQQARTFEKHCGPHNWPNQRVPQHPADWLPHLGLPASAWPEQVPANG